MISLMPQQSGNDWVVRRERFGRDEVHEASHVAGVIIPGSHAKLRSRQTDAQRFDKQLRLLA